MAIVDLSIVPETPDPKVRVRVRPQKPKAFWEKPKRLTIEALISSRNLYAEEYIYMGPHGIPRAIDFGWITKKPRYV